MPRNLTFDAIGVKGLNTDVAAWSLEPDYLTEGRNFRIFANQVNSAGGASVWSIAPTQFFPGYIQHVDSVSSQYWIIPGRDAVYVFDGQTWSDVSSAAGYAAIGADQELNWTGCQMGRIPIVNNPQTHPEYWSPQTPVQILQPLPWVFGSTDWADVNQQCKIIRAHKTWMWALDLYDGVEELRDGVRWSHPAEQNGLPPSWDETDDAYLAGKIALGGDSGPCIDGLSMRNSFVVYSENAINIFDEDAEFIWKRRELSTTVGLLSKHAIVEVKGSHYMLTQSGDIVVNNGTNIRSIVRNRIRRRLSANMNPSAYQRSFAVRNNAFAEIWFCVPEGNAMYPNVAYVYNWSDDSWAIRDITPAVFAGYGPISEPTRTWDTWEGTWAQQRGPWGSSEITPFNDTVIGIDRANLLGIPQLLILDPTGQRDDYRFVVERTNFPLEGHPSVTTIVRAYPHIDGTQEVLVELGSHDFAGGPVRWKPGVLFDPRTERKVDIRTTGELHAWRISATGSGTVNLSGITFDYEQAGTR